MVDFDAGDDAEASEVIRYGGEVVHMVTCGLVEKNDTGEVFLDAIRRKEDVAVVVTVAIIIGDTVFLEFAMNGATGLVGGKNAFFHEGGGNEFERMVVWGGKPFRP